jgi:hypothetical protein
MRMTIHNARTSKKFGAFTPKHNDRNFNIKNAEHIDPERTKNNVYWNWTGTNITFEDAEKAFYEEHCSRHLNAVNQRYREQRHPERMRDMDAYRTAKYTCPEETLLMIGNKDEYMLPKTLRTLCEDLRNWEENTIPGLKVLDMALHVDEEGAPHIHMRKAWIYRDENGIESISQGKTLEAAGIPLPHPDKPVGRHNNRKQMFSAMERQAFFNICKEHGYEDLLEMQPREKSKSGRELEDYKADRAEERAQVAELRARAAEQKTKQAEQERNTAQGELERIKQAKGHARERTKKAQEQAQKQESKNRSLQATESQIRDNMEREQRIARQLAEMNEKARKTLRRTEDKIQELEPYLQEAERRQVTEIIRRQEQEHELTR